MSMYLWNKIDMKMSTILRKTIFSVILIHIAIIGLYYAACLIYFLSELSFFWKVKFVLWGCNMFLYYPEGYILVFSGIAENDNDFVFYWGWLIWIFRCSLLLYYIVPTDN